jgi:hypothetical protein
MRLGEGFDRLSPNGVWSAGEEIPFALSLSKGGDRAGVMP